jgi:Neuraminidase (sialidase)
MNSIGISALMIDKKASMIYAGSSEGTIYKKSEDNGVTDAEELITAPAEYKLSQNYPNPFNPSTTIEFGVRETGSYKLRIYNAIGEQVAELVNGELKSGYHQVHFDASRLSSGIYFYKLAGEKINLTKKMILMK